MNRREVILESADELQNYDPLYYDMVILSDRRIKLVPVLWWDESSYLDYQCDREEYEPSEQNDSAPSV